MRIQIIQTDTMGKVKVRYGLKKWPNYICHKEDTRFFLYSICVFYHPFFLPSFLPSLRSRPSSLPPSLPSFLPLFLSFFQGGSISFIIIHNFNILNIYSLNPHLPNFCSRTVFCFLLRNLPVVYHYVIKVGLSKQ